MRLFTLLGLLTFAVARHAEAQSPSGDFAASTPEPDEPIDLGPPPSPPPGARAIEPDEPSAPAPTAPAETPSAPSPAAPAPFPIATTPRKAEPRPAPPTPGDRGAAAPRRKESGGWYGWKILIADGGALVLALTAQPVGTILGGGAFLLTAPSIHLGHRRELAALGSLTLRIAAPLTLNALIEKDSCDSDTCLEPGVLAGAALASLVDVVLFAHDGGSPKEKKAERVTPTVAVGPKGTAVFLTGSF